MSTAVLEAMLLLLAQDPASALPPWNPGGAATEAVAVEPAPAAPAAVATPAKAGPPYYSEGDMIALRKRYGLAPDPPKVGRKSRWRCLIADPTCGLVVEVQASSGYAFRARQGEVDVPGQFHGWSTARVSYDVWVSIPALTESHGTLKYTRLSLGPKGGIIASDGKSVWGNVGFAGRFWLTRGRLAPAIEFSSGLAFRMAGAGKLSPDELSADKLVHVRGPIGFVADVGVGLGGFGSIIIGGQFDSPLAREDVPEKARTPTAGMFFIAFRGNILWGAPAVLGVVTHATAERLVQTP